MRRDLPLLLAGVLAVAAVATLGDWAWARFGVRDRVLTGVIHGAVLLAAVGGVLGLRAGRVLLGLPLGAAAGVGGALVYYALVKLTGAVAAIFAAWTALWFVFAALDGRLLRRGGRPLAIVLLRGALAAALGGLAFYLVIRTLWGAEPEGGRNYLIQLGAWALAWAPGILAIGLPSRRDAPAAPAKA